MIKMEENITTNCGKLPEEFNLEKKDKVIFDSTWPLFKKKRKFYTGDVIAGCEEWYWCFMDTDVKEFIKRLKEKGKERLEQLISENYELFCEDIDKLSGELK